MLFKRGYRDRMRFPERVLLLCTLAVLITVQAAAISLSGTVPPKIESPVKLRQASEFVVAFQIDDEPFTFNPQKSTNIHSAQLFTAIAEGIATYHPASLEPIPGIAEDIETSEDGLTWEITIREDARFSNGDPITAYTFEDTWFYFIDNATSGDMASLLDVIKGVRAFRTGLNSDRERVGIRAVDRDTLRLELNAPAPYLLKILCHHIFVPLHPDNLRDIDALTPEAFISSGPYKIIARDKDEIYLERNPYYWDKEHVSSKYVRVEIRKSGLDLLLDFSGELVHWSEAYIPIPLMYDEDNVVVFPQYSTSFYYFSENSGPYSMPDVRRALYLLIPWEEIRESRNSLFPTNSLVPQDSQYHGAVGLDGENRELALRLLDEAGYPEGRGLPEFHLAIHPGEALEEMTDRITDAWSSTLGITVITDVVPFSVYLGEPEESPYTMGFITWIGDFYDPYSFLNMWLSDSNFNPGKYQNPEYDTLIRHGLDQSEDSERFVYFREAENILLQQAAVIPVSHGVSVNFVNEHIVDGWYPNLLDIHPFKYFKTHEPDIDNSQSY